LNLVFQIQLASLHHGNRLTSVPAELGRLTALTRLNLRENELTSVPAELAGRSLHSFTFSSTLAVFVPRVTQLDP